MFEAASTTIKRKIDNRDYAEAMDLIEKLRGTLDDSKIGDEAKELYQHKSICHELSGDCHFGMDKLERSLREYEQALNWITKVYSPTEYPCMSVLFKIERLLSHMYTQQEKGLQYEKRWQAGLLMQAEDWLESGMYQMPVIQSETNDHLEKLWHQEVKKQKKAKKKQQDSQGKETRSLADFMDTLYKVLRANQGPLIIITTILLFVSGYQIILNSGKLYEELQGDYTSSSSDGTDPTAKKNRKKKKTKLVVANGNSFSYAGQKEQLLFHARQALVTIGDKVYAVPYRTDPTTVPDFLSLTMTSTLSRCLWLRRTDFGLQLPSGTVLFDRKCPEYKLSNALSTLLSEWSKTPETAAPKSTTYKEPFTGGTRTAKYIDLKNGSAETWVKTQENTKGLERGSVVCFKSSQDQPPVGIAIGDTLGSQLPLGRNGTSIMSLDKTIRPDLEEVVKFGGLVICNDPETLRDLSGMVWVVLLLLLFLLSSFRRLGNVFQYTARFLAGCAFAGLALFLFQNYR